MKQKHIIFFNPKGGVGKSTWCERTAMELERLNYLVSVENTDQQVHITLRENEEAQFCLYDTMGAYSSANMKLVSAASNSNVDALIIVPTSTSKNDFKDIDFLKTQLKKNNMLDKTIFVFTKVRKNSVSLKKRRKQLSKLGFKYCKYSMPILEDFSEERDTARTRNEISAFLHEVLL